MAARFAFSLVTILLAFAGVDAAADRGPSGLAGGWTLDRDRTAEVQPDNANRRDLGSSLPRTTVAVGGVPLPSTGGEELPVVPGTARNPRVLQTTGLTIEPAGERLTLTYDGAASETLKRGDDQGMTSGWSARKLTSRYESTSRKVSQVYAVQRDGSLLVTVKLNPNEGPTLVYKRVFQRAPAASKTPATN